MRVGAILQARLGSTRFPSKVLKPVGGLSLIEWVNHYTSACASLDDVVFAIPISDKDSLGKFISERTACEIFYGSENNVLKRFHDCAHEFELDVIVRITCDDPLKDPALVDFCVTEILDKGYDCVSTERCSTLPAGLGVEVFTREMLQLCYKRVTSIFDQEHVTQYLYNKNNHFNILDVQYSNLPIGWRFTIDTELDFQFFDEFFQSIFPSSDNLISEHFFLENATSIGNLQKKYFGWEA